MATPHKWQFAPRFRRNAFDWKSDTPIQRIKEALAEIKAVAKKKTVLVADDSVLFLEKPAPAIERVDSSSAGTGSAANQDAPLLKRARYVSSEVSPPMLHGCCDIW